MSPKKRVRWMRLGGEGRPVTDGLRAFDLRAVRTLTLLEQVCTY